MSYLSIRKKEDFKKVVLEARLREVIKQLLLN
jgi:hypothetical protein